MTERRESESSRERRLEREKERDDGWWCLGRDPNKYCIHTLIRIRIPSSHGERFEECLEVTNSWAVAGRSGISAVRELVVVCLTSHLVAEEDEDEEDTEAHDAVTALVEQSPLLLPTPLSLVTDATSAAAVVPRLPFLLQTKMVSEGRSPDASSVFSNIPPRPNRV
jgi:hypothetical protein